MSSSSSSSALSGLSSSSSSSSEPTPEWDPLAAYDLRAPEKWDIEDHDSSIWSEDDKSLTDGEDDFQYLVDGELEEESEDDLFSWDNFTSSDEEEEEEDDDSSDEYPPTKRFRDGSETTMTTMARRKRPPSRATGAATRSPPAAVPATATMATTRAATALRLGTTSIGLASTEENSSEETQSSRRDSSSGNSGKTTTQSQPDLPPSASKKRSAPEPAASQAPNKAGEGSLRTRSRCIKRARKEPQSSSLNQEISNTDDTSSGEVEEVPMPSATLDLATSKSVADTVANLAKPTADTQEPITSSSAVPLVLGEGYDLSSLLTFDPESIEPAPSKANPDEVKSILEDIQPHLPVTLQVKLWPVVTLSAYRSRVKSARQRIDLRHAQLPLKADIADKCLRLNEKKAALDAKTDTSVRTAELETLRKELEDLEERVRATKQLIQDKEALISHSHEEAEGLRAELKTDLAEIHALNKQLVAGKDEDDEAKIAEVDRVRARPPCP
ncbi:hypothetical protein QYE76_029375 [Lolium multiflorum]|uniref:Uncharacterized protein n=1 Tax=Lolium multiflorum TaxID=4521 RepID=A0AAD8VFF7_LOLMU|nr:hypothetical protein QYE76_029375 [Lolium multiflorum]